MSEVNKELYYAPKNGPVSRLECEEAFQLLSSQEKKYVHYMSEASWAGAPIVLVQTSLESLDIFRLLQNVFSAKSLDDLRYDPNDNVDTTNHKQRTNLVIPL